MVLKAMLCQHCTEREQCRKQSNWKRKSLRFFDFLCFVEWWCVETVST